MIDKPGIRFPAKARPDLGSNPGRSGKPATNRLSCGTVNIINNGTMKDWFMLKMTVAGSSETLIPTY
jgi:hypothetical protein